MIEETIYNLLSEIAPTFPIKHNKEFPCITYNVITANETYSHDGNSNIKNILIQITCWDTTYANVKTLQNSIFSAFDSYRTYPIKMTFLENIIDLYDDETQTYYCACDYRVNYVED